MNHAPQVPPPPEVGEEAGNPRVPWSWLDAFIVMLLLIVLAAVLQTGIPDHWMLVVTSTLLGVAVVVWLQLRYPRSPRLLIGERWGSGRNLLTGLWVGVVAWLGTVVLGIILRVTTGDVPEVQETFRELAADPESAPLLMVGAIVLGPVAEELFFRGMLFQALRDRLGLWPGIGISSVVFALAHLRATNTLEANLLLFLVIFPLGMALAWLFERHRTLLVPIVVHAVFYGVQVDFLLLGPEGM